MATIRRHYDVLRKTLGAVMILYLLFLGVQFALAMRDGAVAHQTDRIEQLERRIDRLDHELERLDAAQRLTRIETYIETTKEAQAANRQMFLLILATLTLILVGVILLLVGRGPRGMNSPPARRRFQRRRGRGTQARGWVSGRPHDRRDLEVRPHRRVSALDRLAA